MNTLYVLVLVRMCSVLKYFYISSVYTHRMFHFSRVILLTTDSLKMILLCENIEARKQTKKRFRILNFNESSGLQNYIS